MAGFFDRFVRPLLEVLDGDNESESTVRAPSKPAFTPNVHGMSELEKYYYDNLKQLSEENAQLKTQMVELERKFNDLQWDFDHKS